MTQDRTTRRSFLTRLAIGATATIVPAHSLEGQAGEDQALPERPWRGYEGDMYSFNFVHSGFKRGMLVVSDDVERDYPEAFKNIVITARGWVSVAALGVVENPYSGPHDGLKFVLNPSSAREIGEEYSVGGIFKEQGSRIVVNFDGAPLEEKTRTYLEVTDLASTHLGVENAPRMISINGKSLFYEACSPTFRKPQTLRTDITDQVKRGEGVMNRIVYETADPNGEFSTHLWLLNMAVISERE